MEISVIFSPKKEGKEGKAVSMAVFDSIDLKEFEAEAKEMFGDFKEMQIEAQTSSDTLIQK